ncbi:MAG: hypothetical protein KC486_15780 [Myxococcales bacterium]|nr:hypothetical protein [Myxococcales bacterium]
MKPTSTRSKRPTKPVESGEDTKADVEAKAEPEPEPESQPEAKEEAKVVEARPAAATKPPPPPQARLAGEYRYVGGAAQKQRLADTIDQTVQQLNALIRNIGRRRLTESNQVRDAIKIAVDGDRVTTTFVPGGTVTATLDGPQVDWTTDTGGKVKVKMSIVKGRLVQDFKGEDGSRRNVFTVDSTGDKMTMSVTISSSRLTTPMKYALSYKRK